MAHSVSSRCLQNVSNKLKGCFLLIHYIQFIIIDRVIFYFFTFHIICPSRNLQNIVTTSPIGVSNNNNEYIKTNNGILQTHKQLNLFSTAVMLRKQHGMGIFVKGITPKMMQAGVNHSVTFYVYDLLLNIFST